MKPVDVIQDYIDELQQEFDRIFVDSSNKTATKDVKQMKEINLKQ